MFRRSIVRTSELDRTTYCSAVPFHKSSPRDRKIMSDHVTSFRMKRKISYCNLGLSLLLPGLVHVAGFTPSALLTRLGSITRQKPSTLFSSQLNSDENNYVNTDTQRDPLIPQKTRYILGNRTDNKGDPLFWNPPSPITKKSFNGTSRSKPSNSTASSGRYDLGIGKNSPVEYVVDTLSDSKKMVARDAEGQFLSRALWLYGDNKGSAVTDEANGKTFDTLLKSERSEDDLQYEDIDLSIPAEVYNAEQNVDLVWTLLRQEALKEAQREPLLVSFLYSTILNHPSLESALAFHLANRLSSPSMISTQIMSLISEALQSSETFRRYLRADIMAVRDRDPACTCLPDVFLHFKGFHALESHRAAHFLWKTGRNTIAHYLQSQVSQNFQIDIHPNATLESGIMLDHGTGIVIGETARVGHNCSILHHVTLGGSGKRGVDRHPKVGNGVLLGAGASILGNVRIGDGVQVGASSLVIEDLPPHSVAVGVPAKIIGTYKEEESQPGRSMNQVGTKESEKMIDQYQTDGI